MSESQFLFLGRRSFPNFHEPMICTVIPISGCKIGTTGRKEKVQGELLRSCTTNMELKLTCDASAEDFLLK